MSPWTHDGLRARAEWLVRDVPEVGDRFAAVAYDDNLNWHAPEEDETYIEFVDRTLDLCTAGNGDAVIVAWKWPGREYVSVMLACPLEGTTSVAVFPNPQELN